MKLHTCCGLQVKCPQRLTYEHLVTSRWCCLGGGGGASLEAGHREWSHEALEPAILPALCGCMQPGWPGCSCCLCSSCRLCSSCHAFRVVRTESPGMGTRANLGLLELLLSGHFLRATFSDVATVISMWHTCPATSMSSVPVALSLLSFPVPNSLRPSPWCSDNYGS